MATHTSALKKSKQSLNKPKQLDRALKALMEEWAYSMCIGTKIPNFRY